MVCDTFCGKVIFIILVSLTDKKTLNNYTSFIILSSKNFPNVFTPLCQLGYLSASMLSVKFFQQIIIPSKIRAYSTTTKKNGLALDNEFVQN